VAGLLARLGLPAGDGHRQPVFGEGETPVDARVTLEPVSFAALDGWADDDLVASFSTYLRSCQRILAGARAPRGALAPEDGLVAACIAAAEIDPDTASVRAFFQDRFEPHEIVAEAPKLTSYYEPVLDGSFARTETYRFPLYAQPPDLATVLNLQNGETLPDGLTAARRTEEGLVPHFTRAEIEAGALDDGQLDLVWLADPVDVFFVHIQGSSRIRLPDGRTVRIGYAAKNGHPYRSAGKAMLAAGVLPVDQSSAEDMKAWMRANLETARDYMNRNPSYVFFRLIDDLDPALGPIGGEGVPLTSGRSLAIDRSLYSYGLPFWIEADLPTGTGGAMEPFRRLMVAQDTGAAIVGPARGDIFWGTGAEAGETAGRVNNPGRFVVLLPR
jgi:membrane-bound lytic murein transglycosylase A